MYRNKPPRGSRDNRPIKKPNFNCGNDYLAFTASDALFRPNLNRLKDQDFQASITKITEDLNLLLYMTQQ